MSAETPAGDDPLDGTTSSPALSGPPKEAAFLMTEYNALRGEILKRIDMQHQVLTLALTAAGALITVGYTAKLTTIPLLYPVLAFFLALYFSQNGLRVSELGAYVKARLEERLLDKEMLNNGWGWEHVQATARTRVVDFARWSARGIFVGSQIIAVIAAFPLATGVLAASQAPVATEMARYTLLGVTLVFTNASAEVCLSLLDMLLILVDLVLIVVTWFLVERRYAQPEWFPEG